MAHIWSGRVWHLLLLGLLWLVPGPSQATSVLELGLDEHVWMSTAVVEVTVGEATELLERAGGRPNTLTKLHVTRVLAGSAPSTVTVRQVRGFHDGIYHQVEGDGELVTGETAVVFLRHHSDGYWYLSSLALSVYRVQGSGDKAGLRRDLGQLKILRPKPDGTYEMVHGVGEGGPQTLGELRKAVADAVRRRSP